MQITNLLAYAGDRVIVLAAKKVDVRITVYVNKIITLVTLDFTICGIANSDFVFAHAAGDT